MAFPKLQQPNGLSSVERSRPLSDCGHGFAVITGGGLGIMEATNKGAAEAKGESIGLPVEQQANKYQTVSLDFRYFFWRKVMFVKYAVTFVCFPGGFGTMDEFLESMMLIQTDKTEPFPVILIGREFWSPLIDWMRREQLERHGYIAKADLELCKVTDDITQAAQLIADAHKENLETREGVSNSQLTAEGTLTGRVPRRPGPGTHYEDQAR